MWHDSGVEGYSKKVVPTSCAYSCAQLTSGGSGDIAQGGICIHKHLKCSAVGLGSLA